jgi:hypothetical protein
MGVLSTAVASFIESDPFTGAPELAAALLRTRGAQTGALGIIGHIKTLLVPIKRTQIEFFLAILDRAATPGRSALEVRQDFTEARIGLRRALSKAPDRLVSALMLRDIAICSLALGERGKAEIELQESVDALCGELADLRTQLEDVRAEIILAIKLEAKEFAHHKTLAIATIPFGEFYLVGKAVWNRTIGRAKARKSGASQPARPTSKAETYYATVTALPVSADWRKLDGVLALRNSSVGGASATMVVSSFIARDDGDSIRALLDKRKTLESSVRFCREMELELVSIMDALLRSELMTTAANG